MHTTLGLLLAAATTSEAGVTADYAVAEQWDNFKKKYHKTYATAQLESYRRSIFLQNAIKIQKMNAEHPHGVYGLDKTSDLTEAEYEVEMGITGALADLPQDDSAEAANSSLEVEVEKEQGPAKRSMQTAAVVNVDHRAQGLVGRVKNQGQCAWCAVFAPVAQLEGAWAKTGAPFVSLSEEYAAGCREQALYNRPKSCFSGFHGMWIHQWVINNNNGEMVSEEDYPTVVPSTQGHAVCNRVGKPVAARFNSMKSVGHSRNEVEWAQIVAEHGPTYASFNAASLYALKGGIGTRCVSTALTHAITLVGANLAHNPPYWIIKNSWGAGWSDGGYVKMVHGRNCGGLLATYGAMMVVNGGAPTAAPTPQPTPVPTPQPTPDMCPAACTPNAGATLRYLPKRRSLKSVRYSSATKLTGCYLQVQAATGHVKVSMYTSKQSGGRLRTMLPSLSSAAEAFTCKTRCEKDISHTSRGGVQRFTYGARIKIQCHGKVDCRNIKWEVKCWAF